MMLNEKIKKEIGEKLAIANEAKKNAMLAEKDLLTYIQGVALGSGIDIENHKFNIEKMDFEKVEAKKASKKEKKTKTVKKK